MEGCYTRDVVSRETLDELLVEIRRRRAALTRAWNSDILDRVARELSQRFPLEEPLIRSLIREELGERGGPPPTHKPTRTRSDLGAVRDEPES